MLDSLLPHTFTFPFPSFNFLSLLFKKKILSYGSFSTSPLHLPIFPSHLFPSLTSSSPQLIALPISYLNLVVRFFFSLPMIPMVLLLFESQRCVSSPLVSLFIFCGCIYLGALSCMSL